MIDGSFKMTMLGAGVLNALALLVGLLYMIGALLNYHKWTGGYSSLKGACDAFTPCKQATTGECSAFEEVIQG